MAINFQRCLTIGVLSAVVSLGSLGVAAAPQAHRAQHGSTHAKTLSAIEKKEHRITADLNRASLARVTQTAMQTEMQASAQSEDEEELTALAENQASLDEVN